MEFVVQHSVCQLGRPAALGPSAMQPAENFCSPAQLHPHAIAGAADPLLQRRLLHLPQRLLGLLLLACQQQRGAGAPAVLRSLQGARAPPRPGRCSAAAAAKSESRSKPPFPRPHPPKTTMPQEIVRLIREGNPGRPIPPDKVLGFGSIAETNQWMQTHPEQSPGVSATLCSRRRGGGGEGGGRARAHTDRRGQPVSQPVCCAAAGPCHPLPLPPFPFSPPLPTTWNI